MQIPTALQNTGKEAQHLLSTLKTYHYAEAQAPILKVLDVQKRFEQFQALSHINLELKAGEFVSFLGPSGCGKTTLLRIIAGLEHPDYGKIIKKGQDITFQNVEKRRCGIVFQNYALFPNLSVEENIGFGLNKNQWSKAERAARIQQLLELIELPNIAQKYPNQLSGGQQQRVALARAIAPQPDILLLDEPLSALDAQVRLTLRQKIRAIQTQFNLPTIMVTHDQEEALSISDRVVVMNHGVIEQVDTPHNIYYQPQTQFVAQFIGTMNFLAAQCSGPQQLKIVNQLALDLPALNLKSQQNYVIGFRPEAIKLIDQFDQQPDALILPIKVVSSEFLGAKRRLFCRLDFKVASLDLNEDGLDAGDVASTLKSSALLHIEIENHDFYQWGSELFGSQSGTQAVDQQMYIRVAKSLIHVFDAQGRALC